MHPAPTPRRRKEVTYDDNCHPGRSPQLALVLAAGIARSARAGAPTCPVGGATLNVDVDNRSGNAQAVTFTGSVQLSACFDSQGNLLGSYSGTATCNPGQTTCNDLQFTGLMPGIWTQTITVTVPGQRTQKQYKKTVVIGNTGPNKIPWTVFKTVLPVDITTDPPKAEGTCPSPVGQRKCGLRRAIQKAYDPRTAKPVLIQFDEAVFPAGTATTVTLGQNPGGNVYSPPDENLTLASDITIDGTDPNGDPTFRGDSFYRIVQLWTTGSTFRFDGTDGAIIGMSFKRPTLSAGQAPEDVLRFYGSASKRNALLNSQIDGGGANLTAALQGHDCVSPTGSSGGNGNWTDANVVQNTELFYCPDKAVKSDFQSYVKVIDSYIHNNLDAGIQATLSGNAQAIRNLVDMSGYNSTTQVNISANGLAANGKDAATPTIPSVLVTDSNIIRNNTQRAISVHGLSQASILRDMACGTSGGDGNGLSVTSVEIDDETDDATATVRGSAFVYNAANGAILGGSSTANFGTSTFDPGDNALMFNNKGASGGHDFNNTASSTSAVRNEWNGAGCGTGDPCSADKAGDVTISPILPYENSMTTGPSLSFIPTNPKANQLVHLYGSGFDAVESYAASSSCGSAIFNRCPPTDATGVCVQVEIEPGTWATPRVIAVTPTHIAFMMPLVTCAKPLVVHVTQFRVTDGQGNLVPATGMLCTNN
jgi:hypothetical protein